MSEPTNSSSNVVIRLYDLMVRVGNHLQSPLLLFMRVVWGWQLMLAGWGKLTNIQTAITNFRDQFHIPFPVFNTWLASLTETFGGLFLILGLLSRLTSIPLVINFIVAYIATEQDGLKDLLSFDTDKFCADTAFPYLATAVVILIFGPGALSLDYLYCRWKNYEWKGPRL
jgi:putative oxidoreductase